MAISDLVLFVFRGRLESIGLERIRFASRYLSSRRIQVLTLSQFRHCVLSGLVGSNEASGKGLSGKALLTPEFRLWRSYHATKWSISKIFSFALQLLQE